jgi:hypothetical protein
MTKGPVVTSCNKHLLSCPAGKDEHLPDCPWHPTNVQTMVVSPEDFTHLLDELDRPPRPVPQLAELLRLTEDEQAEVDKIVDKIMRGIIVAPYVSSLLMRYNFNRWQLILDEVRRRMGASVGE